MKTFGITRALVIALATTLALSCASLATKQNQNGISLTFTKIRQIQLGLTREAEVIALFGHPSRIISAEDAKSSNNIWIYCERERCSTGRITLQVDPKSELVSSVTWTPKVGEPEQDLNIVMSQFPASTLQHHRNLYNYGHYFEVVESYSDASTGLSLGYDREKNAVTAIQRFIPGQQEIEISTSDGFPKISRLPDSESALNP